MTAAEIAEVLDMLLSTVSAVLKRIGLGKRSRLERPEPPNRYERRHPGELVHVDVKKLGRVRGAGHRMTGSRASQKKTRRHGRRVGVAGWETTRTSASMTPPAWPTSKCSKTSSGATATGFLRRAVAWFAGHGVRVERVMSDNGACYRSSVHAAACRELAIRHIFTRPYRPRTNGKAERFIQTLHQRMGLRPPLRQLHRAHRRPAPLARALQLGADHTARSATNRPELAYTRPTWLGTTARASREARTSRTRSRRR